MNHNKLGYVPSIDADGNTVWQRMYYRQQAARAMPEAARAAVPSLGLSSLHIPPEKVQDRISNTALGRSSSSVAGRVRVKQPHARVARGGSMFVLKAGRVSADVRRRKVQSSMRGRVAGFSRSSRRRLLRLVSSIDRTKLTVIPLFITLTYPAVWPSDPAEWKRHLENFFKRLERRYPGVSCIWRLEPQARGAPHFHLIVFNVPFIPHDWVSRAWFEVVASGDEAHLKAGTEVRRVKSWRGVMSYAAKYVAKPQDASIPFPEHVGRWWGAKGPLYNLIDWHDEQLSFSEFFTLRRILRGYLRSRGVRYGRGSLFSGMSVFLGASSGLRLLQFLGCA